MKKDDDKKHIDVCAQKHGGNPESQEAHESIIDHKKIMVDKIVKLALSRGLDGVTCFEIEQELDFRRSSASARVSELRRDGVLVSTERRRPTDSGRMARVFDPSGFHSAATVRQSRTRRIIQ